MQPGAQARRPSTPHHKRLPARGFLRIRSKQASYGRFQKVRTFLPRVQDLLFVIGVKLEGHGPDDP